LTTDASGRARAPRWRWSWGPPLAAGALAVAAGAIVAACSGGGSAPTARADTSRSSTIAWSADERTLWVTSPDDDQLVAVDPGSLDVDRTIELAGQPRELTVLGDLALVTAGQRADLAVVDLGPARGSVERVPLPCGGSAGVVTVPAGDGGPTRDLAVVTCPNDDALAVVDVGRRRVVATIPQPGRPTGIVREGRTLSVSTVGDGRVRSFAVGDLVAALADAPAVGGGDPPPEIEVPAAASTAAWADGQRTASLLRSLTPGPHGPLGAYQVVDNERRLSAADIRSGSTYGTPDDGRARLEPAIAGRCGARFSSLADEPRRLTGPVALAAGPSDDLVWVVGELSRSVSVVRCRGGEPSGRSATVAAYDIGEGGRGIVLAADGRTAFVDVGFDHQVAALRLPDDVDEVGGDDPIERREPERVGRRQVDDRYLSPLAQQGRRMFNDATDRHLTPFGVVACASCHPSAGEDGLRWRIESVDADTGGIQRKVRRTPPAWQVDADAKPLHWDGGFTSSDDLSLDTVQRLLGGDGLMVDTAALTAYMAEVPAAPAAPERGADEAALRRRGAAVVAAKGCTTCHAGDAGTDGRTHDVLAPSDVSDGDLDAVVTPPLRSVRARAPYGHDGRSATLADLLRAHRDERGRPLALTDEERAAVIAYLDGR
jgi:mono/diheme cytochrome c family protein